MSSSTSVALSASTSASSSCSTNLANDFKHSNPACAIGPSSASRSALENCCGTGATISTSSDGCILFCEPKGKSLNAVNQCLFIDLGQNAPGYSGNIYCNRVGQEYSSTIAGPDATATTTATRSGTAQTSKSPAKSSASRENAWAGLIVAWLALCAVAAGIGSAA